jgi:hypothetical protein
MRRNIGFFCPRSPVLSETTSNGRIRKTDARPTGRPAKKCGGPGRRETSMKDDPSPEGQAKHLVGVACDHKCCPNITGLPVARWMKLGWVKLI